MGQIIKIKDRGTFEFDKTWVNSGGHIAKLTAGGYMHFAGLPIKDKSEITGVIPKGPDLDAALEWWANKDKVPEVPKKQITISPDGTCKFDDGSEIESASDIVSNTPPGAFQDALLAMFAKKQESKEKNKLREAMMIAKATKKNLGAKDEE